MDIRFASESGEFNLRARAIILDGDEILMVRNKKRGYYYPIGGHVEVGEACMDAVIRECEEETGLTYEVDRLVFIHENFYTRTMLLYHEIIFYFLMKPNARPTKTQTDDGESLVWLPIAKLAEEKAFPAFFSCRIADLPSSTEFINSGRSERQ